MRWGALAVAAVLMLSACSGGEAAPQPVAPVLATTPEVCVDNMFDYAEAQGFPSDMRTVEEIVASMTDLCDSVGNDVAAAIHEWNLAAADGGKP